MPVLALGVSHRRAPIELLERLSFGPEDLPKAYHHLTADDAVRGAVVLSTCNRVEVYAEVDAYHAGFQALKGFLSDSREVPAEEFGEPLYSHYEDEAAEHLFSVAAGLDSMVLGEPQILSQVRQAFRAAHAEDATSPTLAQLFRRAVRSGRRAREETAIGASPAAFVQAGATLAGDALGGLEGRRVLVVGAGKMSELAVSELRERRVGPVVVVARRAERGRRLAAPVGGETRAMDRLRASLGEADLVVSATGATGTVITREDAAAAQRVRAGRPLFLLDLAVPRDVEPAAARVEGVSLANIEDLRDVVAKAPEAEVDRVRAIVREEVAGFRVWRRAVRLAPVIQGIYDQGERVRAHEVERLRARLSGLTPEQLDAVDAATRAIVAKLLHGPVTRAKAGDPQDARAAALADLFGLDLPPA
ncbi:MAG TPA: glutamyl-tRNA reductase [Actinomycetota bacterium]